MKGLIARQLSPNEIAELMFHAMDQCGGEWDLSPYQRNLMFVARLWRHEHARHQLPRQMDGGAPAERDD